MIEKKHEEEMRTKLVHHHHQIMRSVPVVYYLSRNGQLQHPHFMEVPLSSPQEGLFLTDIINRLSVLRGKSMPAMYSWSCKRSYKNGFVWHDLSENDFIYPAHGHDEYVLKGSELLPDDNDNEKTPPPPEKPQRRRNQSCSSIDFINKEYSVYQASSNPAAADASTQTDDARRPPPEDRDEIEVSASPPPSDSSPETLETLMEVDRRRRRHEAAKVGGRSSSSVLMQLISCGSISSCGAGHGHMGMGLYKTRVPRGKLDGKKEYFSGSILADTKKEKFPTLKRSTSCNADHHR